MSFKDNIVIHLTSDEHNALGELLRGLSQRFSNDGCNDMELPDTPGNLAMLTEIAKREDLPAPEAVNGKLWAYNFLVLSHLMRKMHLKDD